MFTSNAKMAAVRWINRVVLEQSLVPRSRLNSASPLNVGSAQYTFKGLKNVYFPLKMLVHLTGEEIRSTHKTISKTRMMNHLGSIGCYDTMHARWNATYPETLPSIQGTGFKWCIYFWKSKKCLLYHGSVFANFSSLGFPLKTIRTLDAWNFFIRDLIIHKYII